MGNGRARVLSRPSLAAGTPRWVPLCGLASILAAARAARASGGRKASGIAVAGMGAAVCAFFRDPDRELGDGIVAAADGVISAIEREEDGRIRIATFMRLQDVHVNRAPLPGVVRELRHRPGGFKPAYRKDSDSNERMEWTIETDLGELRLVQIAGLVARRIVPYSGPGDRLERGQRIGMIRFGSRVDVTLPPGVACAVHIGERVRAGCTRLDQA